MRLHAIDVAADDLVVLAEADVVILAAPVRQNLLLLEELDDNVRGSAIVTDTGSTKRAIVDAAKRLPPRFTFIGGHPLGGAADDVHQGARRQLWQVTLVGHQPIVRVGLDPRRAGAQPRDEAFQP